MALFSRHKDRQTGPDFDRFGGRILAGFILGIGLLGGVGGWAFTAMLTGAVIASGTVKVDQNLKAVQHRDGGIVAEIAVREGDIVEAGQVLFRLEDAQLRAELSILSSQLAEAQVRRARLVADRDGLADIDFPIQLAALVARSHARLVDLYANRLIEAPRVEAVERELVQLRGGIGEIDANIARSASRIGEIQMRILAIDETAATDAQRELAGVESRIQELTDRITALCDLLSRTDIRAPIAGQVHEISIFTEGGVITLAEVLATIVPRGATLRTEVMLPTTAIDQVFVGQEARVRFSSFDHRTTPELLGQISYVAPATSTGRADGQPHYVAYVTLLDGEIARLGDLTLLPGMQVEVYLTTQEQSAAAYLARPLVDQFERALREN
jgi:multidrug efflux pump subunit AcrA (membrane-fusion protein)